MYTHNEILDWTLQGQSLFTLCYLISSLVVGRNSFAGFNAILLGLIFAAFIAATFYGLKKYPSRLHFGLIMGGASILIFTSLESAIFWGQYSNCEKYSESVFYWRFYDDGKRTGHIPPECDNRSAMKAVCSFSVFMFLSYIVLIAAMIRFKNDILVNVPFQEVSYSSIRSFEPGHMDAAVPAGTTSSSSSSAGPVIATPYDDAKHP